jgi:NAD(P)H-hydrate epimerase
MKLFTAQQLQHWDAYTMQQEPISSINLMERAAHACVQWLNQQGFKQPVKVFCGKGNNGGDGLAIARLLIEQGLNVNVYILEFGKPGSTDFQTNLQRLHSITTHIHFIQDPTFLPALHSEDLIIDALFGSGLNRPLQGLSEQLVQHINTANATVVSIDVPSGMHIGESCKGCTVVRATYTLTFQTLKLCFTVAENASLTGNITVLNIGLHPAYAQTTEALFTITPQAFISSLIKPRLPFSHKGTYGHALLVAGSQGKMGAAVLCVQACLRSGVGLATACVPEAGLNIMQTAAPEAMCITRTLQGPDTAAFKAIGIGPGLGTGNDAIILVENLLRTTTQPKVLDADALNCLALHQHWLPYLHEGIVLTPHPKEFERLAGACNNDFDRLYKALHFTRTYPVVMVLKGRYTLVAYKGKGWLNPTGNAGMATGGSGDVLTGIITSLLAQGYTAYHAALVGVYLHGLSADMALETQSMQSLLPTDMIAHLGKAYKLLQ